MIGPAMAFVWVLLHLVVVDMILISVCLMRLARRHFVPSVSDCSHSSATTPSGWGSCRAATSRSWQPSSTASRRTSPPWSSWRGSHHISIEIQQLADRAGQKGHDRPKITFVRGHSIIAENVSIVGEIQKRVQHYLANEQRHTGKTWPPCGREIAIDQECQDACQ